MKRTYCPKRKENHSNSSYKYMKNPMLRLQKQKMEKEEKEYLRQAISEKRSYKTEYSSYMTA